MLFLKSTRLRSLNRTTDIKIHLQVPKSKNRIGGKKQCPEELHESDKESQLKILRHRFMYLSNICGNQNPVYARKINLKRRQIYTFFH